MRSRQAFNEQGGPAGSMLIEAFTQIKPRTVCSGRTDCEREDDWVWYSCVAFTEIAGGDARGSGGGYQTAPSCS